MKFKPLPFVFPSRKCIIFNVMRLALLLFFGTTFGFAPLNGIGQEKIHFKTNETLTLDAIFERIETDTDYHFIYRSDLFKEASEINIKKGKIRIDELLENGLKGLPYNFEVEGNNIVLTPKPIYEKIADDQQNDITGTVTDEQGVPLPGVNITVEGTDRGTQTDFDGHFTIEVVEGEVLSFSFVGFEDQTITVGTENEVSVTMKEGSSLDEVVVIGYGTQRREDLTSAISSVDSKSISKISIGNATDVLKGKTPGLAVTANSGQPGASPTVRVRGITSFGGSNDPLYVVDGVQMDNIDWLNQSDIENMQVLKDAAASAIYGVSAAAGVVLITTKEGKKGKLDFSYRATYGLANAAKKIKLLNGMQYATLMNESLENDGRSGDFSDPASFGNGTDWQREIFHTAHRQSHDFSISGGDEKSKFYGSFGYSDIDGIVFPDVSYERKMSMRLNSSHQIFDFLKIGEKVAYTHKNFQGVESNDEESGSPLNSAVNLDPLTPVVMTDSGLGEFPNDYSNPNILINEAGYPYGISHYVTQEMINPRAYEQFHKGDYNSSDDFIGNIYAELHIDDFKFKSSVSAAKRYTKTRVFTPLYYFTSSTNNLGENNLNQINQENLNWSIENTLNYEHEWDKHSLNALLGQAYYESDIGFETSVRYTGLPIEDYHDASFNFDLPSSNRTSSNIDNIETHKASYFGRVIYNYDHRYLFTGTFRRDGSSRFGSNQHWGNFPSFSIGWNASNEEFWPENEILTDLKLRGGYGKLGNDNIGNFQFASYMVSGANYTNGNNEIQTGYRVNTLENPDLHWETTEQTDVGVDVTFFNNLDFSFDWFRKETTDILRPTILPGYVGVVDDPVQNIGSMVNRGIEIELDYNNQWGDFGLSASSNFSYINNKVTQLEAGRQFIDGAEVATMGAVTRIIPGQPYNVFFGYEKDGVFQNQGEVDSYTNAIGDKILPNAQPGDFKWIDTDGDGRITSSDRTILGNSLPKYIFGFNLDLSYKNFDLNVFMEGKAGNKIMQALRRIDFSEANYQSDIMGRWNGEGSSETIPRMSRDDSNENYTRMSDFHLQSGSYLRLKRVNLGYTLPEKVAHKILASDIRFFVSMENLLTITGYRGFDPEIASNDEFGIDRGYYPQAKTFILGVNINF